MVKAGITINQFYAKMKGPLDKIYYPVVNWGRVVYAFPKERAQEAADLGRKIYARDKRRVEKGDEFHKALRERYLALKEAKKVVELKEVEELAELMAEMSDEEIAQLLTMAQTMSPEEIAEIVGDE